MQPSDCFVIGAACVQCSLAVEENASVKIFRVQNKEDEPQALKKPFVYAVLAKHVWQERKDFEVFLYKCLTVQKQAIHIHIFLSFWGGGRGEGRTRRIRWRVKSWKRIVSLGSFWNCYSLAWGHSGLV